MLTAGTKLGPYEIIGSLGAGGMGEVYRARDTKLGRDVALKVLPDLFVHDAERLARFRREAHVLASLNHPNIATIYGLEESAGTLALAMELVEGSTLAERLAQGSGLKTQGLPLDEALPIAKQIADALDAAHDKGIIHRDLKPANIKLRPDGTVKVLDFGLAKALDPTSQAGDASYLANSPTMSADGTRAGVILGTAAYMSPEQARGKPVDKRADIWAFGCVVYEMLTGSMPFTGETITDILGAIVKSDPDWNALPDSTPAAIRTLLRRCLHKEREKRLRDVADARMEIDDALSTPTPRPATQAPAVVSTRLARRERLAWVGAVVVIALVAGVVLSRDSCGGRRLTKVSFASRSHRPRTRASTTSGRSGPFRVRHSRPTGAVLRLSPWVRTGRPRSGSAHWTRWPRSSSRERRTRRCRSGHPTVGRSVFSPIAG
jgi:serine/threonine protein kinase